MTIYEVLREFEKRIVKLESQRAEDRESILRCQGIILELEKKETGA